MHRVALVLILLPDDAAAQTTRLAAIQVGFVFPVG